MVYLESMSYAIYTTEGFVLSQHPSGEASAMYSIYTKDFGLITAKAQSVRLLSSKLRYNLDVLSFSTFSLVKGKEVWRLTGVFETKSSRLHRLMKARVMALVRRLVQGEEVNHKVFETLSFMMNDQVLDTSEAKDVLCFEVLVLMHILSALGYLDMDKLIGVKATESISIEQLERIRPQYVGLVQEVNKAIKATQL